MKRIKPIRVFAIICCMLLAFPALSLSQNSFYLNSGDYKNILDPMISEQFINDWNTTLNTALSFVSNPVGLRTGCYKVTAVANQINNINHNPITNINDFSEYDFIALDFYNPNNTAIPITTFNNVPLNINLPQSEWTTLTVSIKWMIDTGFDPKINGLRYSYNNSNNFNVDFYMSNLRLIRNDVGQRSSYDGSWEFTNDAIARSGFDIQVNTNLNYVTEGSGSYRLITNTDSTSNLAILNGVKGSFSNYDYIYIDVYLLGTTGTTLNITTSGGRLFGIAEAGKWVTIKFDLNQIWTPEAPQTAKGYLDLWGVNWLQMFFVNPGVGTTIYYDNLRYLTAEQANEQVVSITPFPIGIYNPPDSANTSFINYQLIKNMNATYVLMGNDIDDYTKNDAAISQAGANGLKSFINDRRLGYTDVNIAQNIDGGGYFVSNANSLGQTFKVPTGIDCISNSIQLKIDYTNWTSSVTLKLSIYDNPAKLNLVGESQIVGPVSTLTPIFPFNIRFTPGETYYWELTSNSDIQVGWVCSGAGGTDLYSNGTAYQNGIIISNNDFWFNISCRVGMYDSNTKVSNSTIDEIANHYSYNANVIGYNLKDEPIAYMFPQLYETMNRFKAISPSKMTYVNLMPIYYSGSGINDNYGMGNYTGTFLTSNSCIGQTFATNSITNYISTIQLYIDYHTWATNEGLTLKLWNSPYKSNLIAQSSTLFGGGTSYFPIFTLNATVSPNANYYWELTHNGGGDNTVGWVVNSSQEVNWERNGTAYISGSVQNNDFWFTLNQNLSAFSYEDYVYRWASLRPDFLMYDYYPFMYDGSFNSTYYNNMEVIRRQSLKAQIPFHAYIQACGINNSLRIPTVNEMRYQIYTNLAYGCKGYNYFLFWTPPAQLGITNGLVNSDGTINTTNYNGATTINGEILKLGPTLLGLTSQSVYHTGTLPTGTTVLPTSFFFKPTVTTNPTIIGYFKDGTGRKYIMAVNRDFVNSRTLTFVLNPKPTSVYEVSKTTGALVTTNYSLITGKVSASFAPGEGKLYILPTGY